MSDANVIDAPQINPTNSAFDESWAREFAAFAKLLPELLKTHRGKFGAVHGGVVVAIADTVEDAALAAYQRVGYVPLHVGKIVDAPLPNVRIPSPRLSAQS